MISQIKGGISEMMNRKYVLYKHHIVLNFKDNFQHLVMLKIDTYYNLLIRTHLGDNEIWTDSDYTHQLRGVCNVNEWIVFLVSKTAAVKYTPIYNVTTHEWYI